MLPLCKTDNIALTPYSALASGRLSRLPGEDSKRLQEDFYAKLNISLKEADETAYWLELLHESNYITEAEFNSIYADNEELIKLLVSITKSQ